jgi:hypothetical protein
LLKHATVVFDFCNIEHINVKAIVAVTFVTIITKSYG